MKKTISLILSTIMCISLLPITATASSSIKLGDYIQMGTYYGEPILWRCVAFEKISGYDDSGNPIMDATDTVTEYKNGYLPLIISDKILCIKPFDAAGNNTVGSHGRGDRSGYYRRQYGSNYWGDSNIRCWLNSNENSGNVVWTCGNPPSENNVYSGINEYDNEEGFLKAFSEKEKNNILSVTQQTIIDQDEHDDMSIYGTEYHIKNENISSIVQNANTTAYKEYFTDKIFLPEINQVASIYENRDILGDNYYIGIPTIKCVENSEYTRGALSANNYYHYWLRTSSEEYHSRSYSSRYVSSNGTVTMAIDRDYDFGVRPAFFLNIDNANFTYGDGSEGNPYSCASNTTNDDVFDINKYRADFILNSNWEETIEDTYFNLEKMPAHTLKAAAEESNNDIWIDAWDTFTKTIDSVDDASKTLDYVFEEKDMYQAILFDLFESSVDYRIMDCINNDITKNTKNIVDIVTSDMESIYNYDFLKNTNISSMTTAQKDNLISSMEKAFKKEHGNAADISKISGVIGKTIDYAEDFQSYCEMIETCYNVIHLSSSMKQIMLDMYNKCPLDNVALKSALFECVNIMNSSEDAFVYKMSAYFYGVVGKNVAQVAVDKMWKEVKAQVYVTCPEAYVLMAAYKTGKYISNVVFGTDEIAEKYCNIVALVQTEDLLKSVYNDTKSKYLSNKNSSNAATYNSSVDIMFNALNVDCNYANKYATAIDSGLAGKLYAALGMSSTEEFSRSVSSIQDICYNVHESILTGWIYELENDYPSLYNEYSHLLDESRGRIKKRYNIACPVDVYVYNSENTLVASVVNNKIYCIDDNITISVDGDEKTIYFYDNKEYNIVYVGNDEGTMDISVTEYDDNETDVRNVYFNNLELSNGLTYTATESGTSNDDSEYAIIDENQGSIDADYDTQKASDSDIYTASIENGYFDNDGVTVCKELHLGERAVITAFVPKGYEFNGWVSDCAEVIFEDKNSATTNIYMPECDVNITANLIKCPTLSIEEITNNTLTFKAIHCENITTGVVILAIYNEHGSLNDVKIKDFTDEITFNDLNLTNGKAKVMLWDNLDSLTPLTKATEKIFFFETSETE